MESNIVVKKCMNKKVFSSVQSIAEYFSVSRRHLYRLAKEEPFPKWYIGWGSRDYHVKPWTELEVLSWFQRVTYHTGHRSYKIKRLQKRIQSNVSI